MTDFLIALTVVLAGPVDVGPTVAMAQTATGRLAYVTRGECLIGAGWLHVSDSRGNFPDARDLMAPFTLQGNSPASLAAAVLCNHWRNQ